MDSYFLLVLTLDDENKDLLLVVLHQQLVAVKMIMNLNNLYRTEKITNFYLSESSFTRSL